MGGEASGRATRGGSFDVGNSKSPGATLLIHMIKLYDYELSGSCYKVRLLLHFLQIQYERIPMDFVEGEHKREPFLAINPFGELPVLEDGDFVLRDAQAILAYLALKYDTSDSWYPNDPEQRGLISQWL